MLNTLWGFMIVSSIIISLFTGRLSETINGAMNGASEAVSMCVGLVGVMCMWNGIMKIAEKCGLVERISDIIRPVFCRLFKDIPPESEAGKNIIMNITANILGMGNASTPSGVKAMKEMKKAAGEKEYATGDMLMFTVLNTASFQLIPSTLIAMRSAAGSVNAAEIILPIWCTSFCSVVVVILCAKAVNRK